MATEEKFRASVVEEDHATAKSREELEAMYMREIDKLVDAAKENGAPPLTLLFLDGTYRQFKRDMARVNFKEFEGITSGNVAEGLAALYSLMRDNTLREVSTDPTYYLAMYMRIGETTAALGKVYLEAFVTDSEECDCPACTAARAGQASTATH